ncbi:MAG TPA: cupin domain-containing protein, partial [Solirubrobacteraceae bacterium]
LAGRGISWQKSQTAEIGAGDCIVYLPGKGAHTLHAVEPLDVLAFGPRHSDESPRFPRLGLSLVGNRAVESDPGTLNGAPVQFVRESELGPPELSPEPGARPATVVHLDEVDSESADRPRVKRTRRDLGRAAGSVNTGLQHVEVGPGMLSAPLHCHSLEEELFVVLDGAGVVLLDDGELEVRPGHVVSCPAGTGVAHTFRAGDAGVTYLAYGTREPGDVCYYPRSNKVSFRGLGVIVRVEPLDYWEGED